MEEFDSLDDLDLNIEEKTVNKRTVQYVKTFGWITFGLGVIYLLISFFRLIMMSFVGAFAGLAKEQSEALDSMNQFFQYQKFLSIAALILSALFILGGIGYALRREWGRKVYLAVCSLGIGYHLFSGYITFFMLSEMMDPLTNSASTSAGPFSYGFNSISWFFTSLIPIAYLVINIIIAGRSETKAIMK